MVNVSSSVPLDEARFFDIYKNIKQIVDENKNELFKKKLWRVSDLAEFLGISKGHIYNLNSEGRIPSRKKGKLLFFIPVEIFEWVLDGGTT